MATFAIDILTGNQYLLTGNFGASSGSTPSTLYPEVNTYNDLPNPSLFGGYTYLVRSSTGDYLQDRKESGLYFSTGSTWRRLGDIPSFFNSNNFEVYDGDDNTKGLKVETSGITSGNYRTITVQDSDGTIAYLTDLESKVDVSVFNEYTGTTAPNTYLTITDFNSYSGDTLTLIESKQDELTAGTGLDIDNNIISLTGITEVSPRSLILVDDVGGVNVNTISPTPIDWGDIQQTGTTLTYTGNSQIYFDESGTYEISYVLNYDSDVNNSVSIGTEIRLNNNELITETSAISTSVDSNNSLSTNVLSNYEHVFNEGDYIELVAFRVGNTGDVYTVEYGSWIKILKKY